MSDSVLDEIDKLVRKYFEITDQENFIPGRTRIPLVAPQFGAEEVTEAIHSLLSTYVTMGEKVKQFESMFSGYIGKRGGVMVNSGSSAILLGLSSLSSGRYGNRIEPGAEVICPAVSWPTTIYPILNINAIPVFVDVSLENFGINVEMVKRARTKKTRAIMAVHLMGNPCEVDELREIAEDGRYHLIEDACEAHGAQVGGRYAGSFGKVSAFSFYISHHITTIEGGMLLSDDENLLEIAGSQRAHGWIRGMRDSRVISWRNPHIDPRFLFYNTAFNMRPTEIQGAFGIHQLPRLKSIVENRRNIAAEWNRRLAKFKEYLILPEDRPGTINSYFAYPLTIRRDSPFTRTEFIDFLTTKLIDTRPVAGGNLVEQPSATLYPHKTVGRLSNAELIMRNSFFIGLHPGLGRAQRDYVAECIDEFVSQKVKN